MLHDAPSVTKHAQMGTTWEDHSQLAHSNYGPFCNPMAAATYPNASASLDYYLSEKHGSPLQWFEERAACMASFGEAVDKRSPHAGFCVCCTYTTTDVIMNALYWLLQADQDEVPEPRSDNRDETFSSLEQAITPFFTPRPQAGFWFPRIGFLPRKGCSHDLCWPQDISMDFEPTSKKFPRIAPSRLVTIALQAAAHSNWPNGTKTTSLGTVPFNPSQVSSHDVKRGALQDLSTSGTSNLSV